MDILPGFSTQTPHLANTAETDFYISRHRVYERGATLARQALLEAKQRRAQATPENPDNSNE